MKSDLQHFRWLTQRLPRADTRRITVLTGPRQVGKSTLAKLAWPALRYVNLDAIEDREAMRATRSADWAQMVGPAVIDEAQKEPGVFDKVKFAYDAGALSFTALLGSSRLLLLQRVRESLAGRAFLYELWPLMPSEIAHSANSQPPALPLFDRLIAPDADVAATLAREPVLLLGDLAAKRAATIAHLAAWGGMPELLRLSDPDRHEWLRSYQQTWLERDLADLAQLRDFGPFRKLQRIAMLRSGGLLTYADLARDADVAPTTAKRYLEYLQLSFQIVLLEPWSSNLTSAVVKMPKIYWSDLGTLRQGTGQWGPLTGALFETLVVTELHKWIQTMARDATLSFYRTR